MAGLIDAIESYVPNTTQPKPDQRKVVVDAIEHVRRWWLMTPEYDEIQGEIDAIITRIQAIPSDNQVAFQATLREILYELKDSKINSQASALDLLTNLINSNVSPNTKDFIRQQAHLFIATVIEMYVL